MFKHVARFVLLTAILTVAVVAKDEPMTSPLKAAFQRSRAENNIDVVLPALKAATLYVIVASVPGSDGGHDYIRTKSPNPERWCITVAESEATLKDVPWPKRKVKGADLLKELPAELEIVVAYSDGGDYLTREQLDWYRQSQ